MIQVLALIVFSFVGYHVFEHIRNFQWDKAKSNLFLFIVLDLGFYFTFIYFLLLLISWVYRTKVASSTDFEAQLDKTLRHFNLRFEKNDSYELSFIGAPRHLYALLKNYREEYTRRKSRLKSSRIK